MLQAVRAGRLNHAPQDENGETPFPNHRGFRQELSYGGDEEFDIRQKLPADFAGLEDDNEVDTDEVAAELESLLAEQNPHFELVSDADQEDEN